jgi:hypothetical protein
VQKRRFSRISFAEKSIVEFGGSFFEVDLLNISLKGALVQFGEGIECRQGDTWKLSFHLGNSDINMEFKAVVAHTGGNLAGVKFVETDLNTMIHLRNLMEARTMDPEKVRSELNFLIETDK